MEKIIKPIKIEITELFLVKAGCDFKRTFIGSLRREVGRNRNPVVCGEVIVVEGMIWSQASNQEELMNNMDELCLMKLDIGLHSHAGVTTQIFGEDFILN